MRDLRHLARTNHVAALLLMLLALAVRLAIPAGYMPAHDARGATMILCSGQVVATTSEAMPAAMSAGAMAGHAPMHHAPADGDHRDMPCGFAGMAIASTGDDLPVVVLATIAYVAAPAAVAPAAPAVRMAARLRPPLRAPPVAQA